MDVTHLLVVCAVAIVGIFVVYWILENATMDPSSRKVAVIAVIIAIVVVIVFLLHTWGVDGTAIRVP
jgi:hypothetical protein